MAIKRVIGCLVVKGGIVVQSIGFEHYLPVGRPEIAAHFFDQWGVDETIVLDIDASHQNRLIDPELVHKVSKAGFAALTAGGGIQTPDDIRILLEAGADKVSINRAATAGTAIIETAAKLFGSQSVIASVDVRKTVGGYQVFTDSGRKDCCIDPLTFSKRLADSGAGEIFLTSIDRDGGRNGYDLELIEQVAPTLGIPVIVCGGAGHPADMEVALAMDSVSAVAAANFFHHSEQSVSVVKSWLRNADAAVRGEYHAMYRSFAFSDDARPLKRPESDLSKQDFEPIEDDLA